MNEVMEREATDAPAQKPARYQSRAEHMQSLLADASAVGLTVRLRNGRIAVGGQSGRSSAVSRRIFGLRDTLAEYLELQELLSRPRMQDEAQRLRVLADRFGIKLTWSTKILYSGDECWSSTPPKRRSRQGEL